MDNDKCKFLLMESEWEIPLAHRGWFVPLFDIKAVIYAGNVANISKFVCGHSHPELFRKKVSLWENCSFPLR